MNIRSKKLCIITPSLRLGGMERVLTLLANYAAAQNIKVVVVCLIKKEVAYELSKNIVVLAPNVPYEGGFFEKFRVVRYLMKVIAQEAPDTILSFSEVFNPLGIVSAKLAGRKIFISDRSSPEVKLPKQTVLFQKILYPFANGLISQTEQARKHAKSKKYNSNIIVIPNPLRPINDIYPKRYEKKVISMGRLVPSKNFGELIDIFLSADRNREWELIILGEGPEKNYLEKKIKDLKAEDRVKLVGAVDDVDYHFSFGSIFAFTSLSEGFPNALSEAVAFPLASISYDCPAGPSDIVINNENGFLIPMNDRSQFIEKLSQLMTSIELREKFIAHYEVYRHNLSREKICKRYVEFIFS